METGKKGRRAKDRGTKGSGANNRDERCRGTKHRKRAEAQKTEME